MLKSFCLFSAMALAAIAVPTASADSFTFNVDYCSSACLGGVASANNGGTVSVTQVGAVSDHIVDVLVTLNSLTFHAANGSGALQSFAFNISNNPTLSLVTGTLAPGDIEIVNAGGSTWSFFQPAGNTSGAGSTFGYSFKCNPAPGGCTGSPSTFEFKVDVAGLTPTSFETKSGSGTSTTNVDFAANVANGSCTGMIGAGNGTGQSTAATTGGAPNADCAGGTQQNVVPEPTSIALLGGVILWAVRKVKLNRA